MEAKSSLPFLKDNNQSHISAPATQPGNVASSKVAGAF